ncbi:hypothetical protein C8F04DRAFT_1177246 [Mycena alexandri]|uniref:Uncharacterized protein n=1 Tax=Mycena alexandri TaxID=1745969 RepID=A0AAD6X716_9AGAR|nr:hypothetical protein C8F04DRAFT_1177246 [Mycena alexandri]
MQACTWFPKLFAANLAKSECRPQAAHYPPSSHPVNACYAPLRLMGTLSSTPSLPSTVLLLQEALTWSPQVSIAILKIDIITFHEDPSPQVLKIFVCAIQGLNLLYYVALTQVPNNEILDARSVKFVPSCLCRPTATELLPSVALNATSCYRAVAGCYQVLPTGGLVYRGFPATGATECYLVKPVFPDANLSQPPKVERYSEVQTFTPWDPHFLPPRTQRQHFNVHTLVSHTFSTHSYTQKVAKGSVPLVKD